MEMVAVPTLPRASTARIVIRLPPGTRKTEAVQFGSAKVTGPLPPMRPLVQVMFVTPMLSLAVPVTVSGRVWVTTGGRGDVMTATGAVTSEVTVRVSLNTFPMPSVAVTTIVLVPDVRGTEALQALVPFAIPLSPVVTFAQVTSASDRLSDAVPEMSSGLTVVAYVGAEVGPVMTIV